MSHDKADMFSQRRKALKSSSCSDCIYIFFSNDEYSDFMNPMYTPYLDRNFYYFSGVSLPECALLIDVEKDEDIIFLSRDADTCSAKLSAFDKVFDMEDFTSTVMDRLCLTDKKICLFSYYAPLEENNKIGRLASAVADKFGIQKISNSFEAVSKLRQTKDETELQNIKDAILHTGQALEYCAMHLTPGKWEYQVKADFAYQVALQGLDVSFLMAASGKNAMNMHYLGGGKQLLENEVVLFDLGCCVNNYTSDISRAYPVCKNFTPRQLYIYDIVLEAQQLSEGLLKPGVSMYDINCAVKKYFIKTLLKAGIISFNDEVDVFYPHKIGHSLGMYIHDPWNYEDPTVVNGVYTLEPGLYLKSEGFGIRIEDNYLVTPAGNECLSAMIKKDPDDIRMLMESGN